METDEEKLLREIFGPLADGCLVLRAGGWTIEPFKHGGSFAVTPPVVPQIEENDYANNLSDSREDVDD